MIPDDLVRAAVQIEREACAEIADANWLLEKTLDEPDKQPVIAGLIRARGGGGAAPVNIVDALFDQVNDLAGQLQQARLQAASMQRTLVIVYRRISDNILYDDNARSLALSDIAEAVRSSLRSTTLGQDILDDLTRLAHIAHDALEQRDLSLAREGALRIFLAENGLEEAANQKVEELTK